MNLIEWARGWIYARHHKNLREVLYEISALTEGLSTAVRQISELHTQIPGNNFMALSISDGLLKRIDTVGAGVTLLVGRVSDLERTIQALDARVAGISSYLVKENLHDEASKEG